MYTVTRQIQWPGGDPVVEVSNGGIDFTNPDALVEKYPGEFEEFDDPRIAVETAIEICKAWRKDGCKKAKVGIGATGGMTMPFDTCSFKEAIEWANKEYESLGKCDRCGELLPKDHYVIPLEPDLKFCREYCADETYNEMYGLIEEELLYGM